MNEKTKTVVILVVLALMVVFWWQSFVPKAASTGATPIDDGTSLPVASDDGPIEQQ